MRSWKSLVAVGVGCLFLASSTCYAGTIYACKKKVNGQLRIVGAAKNCLKSEVKISWPDWADFVASQTQDAAQDAAIAALQTQDAAQDAAITTLATLTPVAFGFIRSDGSVASGTPSLTGTYDATYDRYEITIPGENYFWTDYVTNVTLASNCGSGYVAQVGSVGGKLLVYIYPPGSATGAQCYFQFVTYKP